MIDGDVRWAAERFWKRACTAGAKPATFPRDLEEPACDALPVSIEWLPTLDGGRVQDFIRNRRLEWPVENLAHHCFRGLLLAAHGHGMILLDASDDADERRFSLAHEIAHFIVDYWWPRQYAISVFGDSIRAVLDGQRTPSPTERVHAALSRVRFGFYQHITARAAVPGLPFDYDPIAEDRADQLALELLAPWEHIAAMAKPMMRGQSLDAAAEAVMVRLRAEYGLPANAARAYADAAAARLWQLPTYHELYGRKK